MKQDNLFNILDRLASRSEQLLNLALGDYELEMLTFSQVAILNQLMVHHELSMKTIGSLIYRDKSTITPLINRLVHLGYVIKLQTNQDKRVFNISITQKGLKLKSILEKISEHNHDRAYRKLSTTEQHTLLRLLNKVDQSL